MMARILHRMTVAVLTIVLLVSAGYTVSAQEFPAHVDAWLREAKVGPYQETDPSAYDEIYEAAKREGRVVIYIGTSRASRVVEGFKQKYPGIDVVVHAMTNDELLEKFVREQQAGIYNVDIISATVAPYQEGFLVPNHMLFPWVPPELMDVIPERLQSPLMTWRLTFRNLAYNTLAYPDGPPIQSLWDLTRPEWKGRIVMADPRLDGPALDFLTTVVLHADEMAADYERVFGEPIRLTTPNAGYEWIKRLLANEPSLYPDEHDLDIVGDPQATPGNAPIAVSISGSRYRTVGDVARGNLQFAPLTDLTPRSGVEYPALLNIAYRAPHPNAAKLFIHWLFGDEQGGAGFAPWFEPGNYPVRTDIVTKPEHEYVPELTDILWPLDNLNLWPLSSGAVWDEREFVLDFVMDHLF